MNLQVFQMLIKLVLSTLKESGQKAKQPEQDKSMGEGYSSSEHGQLQEILGGELSRLGSTIGEHKIATGIFSAIVTAIVWGMQVASGSIQLTPGEPQVRNNSACIVAWKGANSTSEITSTTCVRNSSQSDELDLTVTFPNRKGGGVKIILGESPRGSNSTSGKVTINDKPGTFRFDAKKKLFTAQLNEGDVFKINNLANINN